jgi:phage anti-repressor protein
MRRTAKIEGEAKEMDGLKVVESGIISVYEDEEARTLVNAREMHEYLRSRQQFSDWVRDRIERYELSEGEDYIVFHKNMKNSKGGRPSIEYLLTIDVAREIAMVENNDKGRQVRRYFIECERRLKAGSGTISAKDSERLRQRAKRLEIMDRNARSRQARILKFVLEFFRDILSDTSMQVIANEMTVLVTGVRLIELPEVEKPCSAGETGEMCGIIADMVARIASEFGLKTEECGKFVLSKSPSV